jgi:hypothetical protein
VLSPQMPNASCPECGSRACKLVACLSGDELQESRGTDAQASRSLSLKLEYECTNAECRQTFFRVIHNVVVDELVIDPGPRRLRVKRGEMS